MSLTNKWYNYDEIIIYDLKHQNKYFNLQYSNLHIMYCDVQIIVQDIKIKTA